MQWRVGGEQDEGEESAGRVSSGALQSTMCHMQCVRRAYSVSETVRVLSHIRRSSRASFWTST
jgi:hypothetical protein